MPELLQVCYGDASELADEGLYQRVLGMAPQERRARAERFMFRKDRQLSLAAWLLLDTMLRRAGLSEYSLEYGPQGKPRLAQAAAGLHFNLSHSEQRVMCAVSDSELGCDVERVRDIDLGIARRFFYAGEHEYILSAPDAAERRERFYRLWTLKESYMKATGLGMSLPLDEFEITISGESISLRRAGETRNWHFCEYSPEPGYRYALCSTASAQAGLELLSLRRTAGFCA